MELISKFPKMGSGLGWLLIVCFTGCADTARSVNSANDAMVPTSTTPSVHIESKKNQQDDSEVLALADTRARLSNEQPLRQRLLSSDVEIRFWIFAGENPVQGVIAHKRKNTWTVKYLPSINAKQAPPGLNAESKKPKSGADIFFRKLVEQGVFSIRDDSITGEVEPFPDSELILVEFNNEGVYGKYSYNAPRFSESNDGKLLTNILKILSDELEINLGLDGY